MPNRINVKNVHYSVITVGPDGTFTYATPKKIAGAMKVAFNPKVSDGQLFGDGVLADEISKITGGGIALEINKIPTADFAAIYGYTIGSNGEIKVDVAIQPKQVAIGWEVEQTGGKSEVVWFLNCKAQPMQKETQQSTDNTNFSTDTLNLTCIPDKNGVLYMFGDTSDTAFKLYANWFKSIPPTPTT